MGKRQVRYLFLTIVVVILAATPSYANLRDAFVGDVLVVAWLEDQTVKVALANDTYSRKTITISSAERDYRWQPYFSERTIVIPAQTVVIEGFRLNSNWQGAPLKVEVSAWERRAVVAVQTPEIFRPGSFVVRAQEDLLVQVDLSFLLEGSSALRLTVDDLYRGWAAGESGPIQIKSVEGGFKRGQYGNSVQFVSPTMLLYLRSPAPRGDVTVINFSMYKQYESSNWSGYKEEVAGPTIMVYNRNLQLRDNSHLAEPPGPTWEWRYNN